MTFIKKELFLKYFFLLEIKEGLDTLRMLFYANLLSGQRDSLEIIEIERENDEKMEIELVNRRQRHNDDADDNKEQDQNEQQTSGETTPEATTTSAAVGSDRLRNPTKRTSTNESPFDNPLQIKLALKPNEYRYGRYRFDDFMNEYVNEKIDIRKEYLDYIQRPNTTIQFSFITYPFFLSTINKTGS